MHNFFIIISFLFVLNADAKWSSSSREKILNSSKTYNVLGPPGYVSLWGGVKRKWSGGDLNGDIRKYYAKDYFKKGSLPIYFHENEKQAPLSIFFPGIFGKHDGDLSPGMINLLESKNSHVAVIPNFLSDTYIKTEPIYHDDVSKTDIGAITSIIEKILLSIPEDKITRINLIGESLGSFVASGVLSEISNKQQFEKYKINLVLFWPPLKLNQVLTNFDKEIQNTLKTYNDCNFWYRYPLVAYHFIWQKKPKDTSEEFVKCMDSYLYHGVFKVGIENSIKASMEVHGKGIKDVPKNFNQYFKTFNKKFYTMIEQKSEKLRLSYWLSKRNQSQTTVRIISSKDDFINKGISWEEFLKTSYLEDDNLILLPWGAHSGGLAMDIWPEVLYTEILFKKKKRVGWPFSIKSI